MFAFKLILVVTIMQAMVLIYSYNLSGLGITLPRLSINFELPTYDNLKYLY